MIITYEKSLKDFDFWSGAEDNAAKLASDELDQLDDMLSSSRETPWDETEINDFMRFEFETICEWLGLDYAEVMARE